MSMTPKERLDEFLENYMLALAGVDKCPDNAPATIRARLADNALAADSALSNAIADELKKSDPTIDAAIAELANANEVSRNALRQTNQIAQVLGLLQRGTTLATRVLTLV